MIVIREDVIIDESDIREEFVRASGPGGQNVNKVSTAVQLRFDMNGSSILPDDVRARLIQLAGNRISKDGILVIDARQHRTQEKNRQDARERLITLIRRATFKPRPRVKTRPSQASRQKRLDSKRHQSLIKKKKRSAAGFREMSKMENAVQGFSDMAGYGTGIVNIFWKGKGKMNQEHYDILKNQGVEAWNKWRDENPDVKPDLRGADFIGADLMLKFNIETDVRACTNFTNTDFRNAKLSNTNLNNADLSGADLSGANLSSAKLYGARLNGARLYKTRLRGAFFSEKRLDVKVLNDTDLRDSDIYLTRRPSEKLTRSSLSNADLSGADLCNTDLYLAGLNGVKLTNANLRDANLIKTEFIDANLTAADLTGSKLIDSDLRFANLCDAKLIGADLRSANLMNASLINANLSGIKLIGAKFQGAKFKFCTVDGSTIISNCEIDRHTDFRGVDLDGIRIDLGIKELMKYNTRRMNWEDWYKKQNITIEWFVKLFWSISDYGRSTGKLLATFFISSFFFAMLYSCYPNIINGLKQEELQFLRAFYFSIVTMTTLGFGDMYAAPGSFWGYILLMLQVLLGYVLLGALITRLSILFTAEGPSGKFTPDSEKNGILLASSVFLLSFISVFFILLACYPDKTLLEIIAHLSQSVCNFR